MEEPTNCCIEKDKEIALLKKKLHVIMAVADQLEEEKNSTFEESKIYFQKLLSRNKDTDAQIKNSLIEGQEMERERISETLHDSIGQLLIATKMHITGSEEHLPQQNFSSIQNLIQEAIIEVRNLSQHLKPPNFLKKGFLTSLQCMMNDISVNFDIKVQFSPLWKNVSEKIEIQVFRIIQELITNASKHSTGNKIELTIEVANDNFNIMVIDNGKGFNIKDIDYTSNLGSGLENIQNRIERINGQISRYYDGKFYTVLTGPLIFKES